MPRALLPALLRFSLRLECEPTFETRENERWNENFSHAITTLPPDKLNRCRAITWGYFEDRTASRKNFILQNFKLGMNSPFYLGIAPIKTGAIPGYEGMPEWMMFWETLPATTREWLMTDKLPRLGMATEYYMEPRLLWDTPGNGEPAKHWDARYFDVLFADCEAGTGM